MKKRLIFTIGILLSQLLFFQSCQKETKEGNVIISKQVTAGSRNTICMILYMTMNK